MSFRIADTLGLEVSHEALNLIAEVGEFKGTWEVVRDLSPERLRALRHVRDHRIQRPLMQSQTAADLPLPPDATN